MKCMKKDRKWDHISEEKITLGWNPSGFKVLREKRVFGREKEGFLLREIEENEVWNRVGSIYRKHVLMDWGFVEH